MDGRGFFSNESIISLNMDIRVEVRILVSNSDMPYSLLKELVVKVLCFVDSMRDL